MMTVVAEPVLGEQFFAADDIVIAWGWIGAYHEGVDYERWLIITLLPPKERVPNVKNYCVTHYYPAALPPNCNSRIETQSTFPNIVPAVEWYVDNGMDY
jgi:hypothetical protein